jgi:formate dehydrogenase (hydrogenase)
LGIQDQELVWISSRRGKVITRASVTDRVNKGAVYMTYQWWIGACNELTIHHLDPISKTPEYKYCAVAVEKIADQDWAEKYVQEEYSKIKAQMRIV